MDLNGKKEPNIIGIDVIPFILTFGTTTPPVCTRKFGLFPLGLSCVETPTREGLIDGTVKDSSLDAGCKKGGNSSRSGGYCGALIMYDGWEIKDDYPVKF